MKAYLIVFENKPAKGYQPFRGQRRYMTAAQAIKAAKKLATQNFNVSAMEVTSIGNLVKVLWTTKTIGETKGE